MKSEEIRQNYKSYQKIISSAKEGIVHLRKVCPHNNTSKGNYSYRVGSLSPAIICDDCGKVVECFC